MARWILGIAIVAGASYYLADRLGLPDGLLIAWKGCGVALLALWCVVKTRGIDGWLMAIVMAFGSLGDMLVEWRLEAGAGAFLVGHVVAMLLYCRNWRPRITFSQRILAALVVPVSAFIAAMLVPPAAVAGVTVYAAFVGGMAASAWTSRFPRYRTGIGAMMFLASDLLIFAQMGPLSGSPLPHVLIWPLYFTGQVLIAYGVVRTLSTEDRGSTP